MTKQSQNKRVLEVIKKEGFITNEYAITKMGIWRLSARIRDLKEAGLITINPKTDYIKNTKIYCYVAKTNKKNIQKTEFTLSQKQRAKF